MKISNLVLPLLLALFVSSSVYSQTHVISIHNDDEDIHLEYEDGEVSVLKIDGVTIPKSNYRNYQHIFNKYKDQSKSGHYATDGTNDRNEMQHILLEKLKDYLSKDENFNRKNLELKLTSKKIFVNGKQLNKSKLKDCLAIFEETAGYELSKGSYFKVDISPDSKSISLSLDH